MTSSREQLCAEARDGLDRGDDALAIKLCETLADRCWFAEVLQLLTELGARYSGEQPPGIDELLGICQQGLLYTRTSERPFDLHLLCAPADREAIREPLTQALTRLGVRVAPDTFGPSVADSLAGCDALVLVLSKDFFDSGWPAEEIHGLLEQGAPDYGRLLPVWHEIARNEVLVASPPLENKLAFDTARLGIPAIAQGLADIIRPDLTTGVLQKAAWDGLLKGRTLGEALAQPRFEFPLRHGSLPDDLVARIRLVRAALLDGFRHPMAVWLEGFRRELEPYRAIREWEILARTFHELLALVRHLLAPAVAQGSKDELATTVADLVGGFATMAETEQLSFLEAYAELARLSASDLFLLTWTASQPAIVENQNLGFSPLLVAITEARLLADKPVVDTTEADFESAVGAAKIDAHLSDDVTLDPQGLQQSAPRPWAKEWDVFISHASEDKEQVVRPLAEMLKAHGAKVWYDSFALREGLSLSASIDAGIDAAEFGIIVLSPNFVRKDWPRYELERLRERTGEQADRVLTVWHRLALADAPEYSVATESEEPPYTTELPIPELEKLLLQRIRPELAQLIQRRLEYAAASERISSTATTRQTVTPSPRRYERLGDDLVERVRLLHAVLFEGYPRSMDFWIDGFLRDYNPEAEIAHWERMAAMFQEAALAVDVLQKHQRKGLLRRLFDGRRPILGPRHVFHILSKLVDRPGERASLLEQFPEKIVDTIAAIAASPSVIEVLDDA